MQVRPFQESDAPGVAALTNAALGRRTTPEQLLLDIARATYFDRRWVLEDAGQVVGMARLNFFPFTPPGYLQALIVTDPVGRGQGRGRALWETLRASVPDGVLGLSVSVRDDDPHSLDWAERRGLTRQVYRFASELDLLAFNLAPFQADLERAAAQGIRFITLQNADEATLERYLNFHADRLTETPDLQGHPRWDLAEVRRCLRLDHEPHLDNIFLAVSAGGEWLGNTAVVIYGDMAYNELTAVHPQARGQGLALPLKLQAVQAARQAGLKVMRTNNHSLNAPMLAVNERLGFQRKSGAYELHLHLN